MKEEQVTKNLLQWLISNSWSIVCFDFPQSGTGRILHPDDSASEKNKSAIIPDIVAVKDGICLFFENKDRFYYQDFEKQNFLITNNRYENSIAKLLQNYSINCILYGIGMPLANYSDKAVTASSLVDFVVCVSNDTIISVVYNPHGISFV